MDKEWKDIAEKLPVQPCQDLINDVFNSVYESGERELGTPMLLFHREAVTLEEPIKEIMTPEDWERRRRTAKHRWGARCTCTACGENFIAGYHNGGIVLEEGPDGTSYAGYAEPGADANVYMEGETAICPMCWEAVEVTRRADLRNGRTFQVLQAEVVNAGRYTAVMYWLIQRYFDDTGADTLMFLPHAALVIDDDGKLHRFRAQRFGNEAREVNWVPCANTRDPMQVSYYSWEAADHRKIGGWTWGFVPDLAEHTGEKTALEEYIGADGNWIGAYLHVWAKHPQVENLMRHGFANAVTGEIDTKLESAGSWTELCDAPPIPWVDWREKKPNRMLHMSKDAFRVISNDTWGAADAEIWSRYRQQIPNADALDYEHCISRVGSKAVGQLLEMAAAGWQDFLPVSVVRYLEKRGPLVDGVQLLIDYRKMLRDAQMVETEETVWPRDLIAAHERLCQFWAEHLEASYKLSFESTFVRYRDLEWTDGDLCVVIPKAEADLISEGAVLRHCVGTYGKDHCSGRPVFFIRHYRRPERSYYTLQINMDGEIPKEIQLHGYGNERHGEHKQHIHHIPKKVREFCDRWEREILMPWFAEKKAKRKKGKSQKKAGRIA